MIAVIIIAALILFWLLPTDNEAGIDIGVLIGNVEDPQKGK